MASATPNTLRIWTGADDAATSEAEPGSDPMQEAADRLYTREAFRGPPKVRTGPRPEPYGLSWFEAIARQRYARHGYWIPRMLEFGRHRGETLLGLGEGLGTDWLEYARNEVNVIACSPSQEQLGLVRRNFELNAHSARFLHAPPHVLPLDNSCVDVVCVFGLLHEVEQPAAVIDEVYRVLRPGGKVIVTAPSYYDADYWHDAVFPWRRWFRGDEGRDEGSRGATARSLRRDFARFVEHKVGKRHLRRAQLPQLWRPLPLSVMERWIGGMLVLKAFKPVSAAMAMSAAA